MNWLSNLSLRQKLMLISIAPTGVAIFFLLAGNIFVDRQVYREILENELLGTARMLAFNSTALLEFDEKLAGVKLLEATRIYPDIDYACIYDRDGNRFSEYNAPDNEFVDKPSAPRQVGTYFDADTVSLYHPIYLGDERLGTIFLHSTMRTYHRRVRQEFVSILVLLILSALIALLFAVRVQRLIYNPVTQLAGAAQTISRTDDYSLRVIKQGNDELGDLVDQFNHMLRRIQEQNSALKREIVVRESAEQQLTAANEELQFEIGQRVQAEGQLGVLLEDLERKNDELQDFAYVVSHDLKAPLRGINSLATWLIKDYGDQLDEKGIKYLDQLRDRTRRMHTFIEGILKYSRLGSAQINRQFLDTQLIVNQVVETLSPPPGIRVLVPDPLPTVYYDKLFLLQLFQNLIGNAIQHMDAPTGEVTITCKSDGDSRAFSIADTGPGIDKRHHDRIFKIFQSLKPKDDQDSSGIGLTLVKKIVERNGGRIWVESEPGQGACFTFTVPAIGDGDVESNALSIVVIDANKEYAKHTTKLLANLGHRVRATTTWEAAHSVLAESKSFPDVFLIDPTTIQTDADGMLREIHIAFPRALVIACIPDTSLDGGAASDTSKFTGTITKPFTLDKMNAILRALKDSPAQGIHVT